MRGRGERDEVEKLGDDMEMERRSDEGGNEWEGDEAEELWVRSEGIRVLLGSVMIEDDWLGWR